MTNAGRRVARVVSAAASRRDRRSAAVLAGVAVAFFAIAGPAAFASTPTATSAAGTARLVLSSTSVSVGQRITVEAVDFPPGAEVDVQVCGNGGLGGSTACDEANTFTAETSHQGYFLQYLDIGQPPQPCPCLVEAISPSLSSPITVPITISGVSTATPQPFRPPAPSQALDIVSAQLTGSGPWTALFGGPATRTLVLTVKNPEPQAITVPELVLVKGKAPSPGDEVLTPQLGILAAGEQRTYDLQVIYPPFATGSYEVSGHFAGVSSDKTFAASTHLSPWALIVLIVVLVVLLVAATTREIVYSVQQHRKKRDLQWYDQRLAMAGGVAGTMTPRVMGGGPAGTGSVPGPAPGPGGPTSMAPNPPGGGSPGIAGTPPVQQPPPTPQEQQPTAHAPAPQPVQPAPAPRQVPSATPIAPPSGPAAPRAVPDWPAGGGPARPSGA